MALRVLLADESSTIKKVMQLALSDFGVEVKSVPVGLDVLAVTKNFKPDIIFADVLLTKRSGYDVCADLKQDSETTHIPVVLMWSGFMEIDEARAVSCKADRRLEKPFDADHLRSLVKDLVQKTSTNPVSSYLNFPSMPDFEEVKSEAPAATAASSLAPEELSEESIFAIPEAQEEGFATLHGVEVPLPEVDEEFSAVPLMTTPKAPDEADEGGWAHQDLSKFKIQLPEAESEDFASKFVIPQDEELSQPHVEVAGDFEEISFMRPHPESSPVGKNVAAKVEKSVREQMMETLQKKSSNAQPNNSASAQSKIDINENMVEKILREEAREVIESVCWKVLPDIAERLVREEINKLLKEVQ